MKIKKLLPGGLLTATMRSLVKAGQKSGMATMKKRIELNKGAIETTKNIIVENPKKFVSVEDKLGPEVIDRLARNMARNDKVGKYKQVLLSVVNQNPKLAKEMGDVVTTSKKLDAYDKKNFDITKALIDKDIAKPTLQRSGGFIDMTKDKKYWKGIL